MDFNNFFNEQTNYLVMKKIILITMLVAGLFSLSNGQDIYTSSGGEMICQMSQADRGGNSISTNLRWTVFLHVGQYVNFDFGKNFGLYTGLALRNVGFIMNENRSHGTGEELRLEKHIYRTYNLGVPLAIKFGSLDNHLYFFGGAEYEWQFQFKHKYWPSGNGSRSNEKVKYTAWFTDEVRYFVPSVFVGVQFPGGINLQFKYYLQSMLNQDYKNSSGDKIYEDLNVQMFYISLSYRINNRQIKKKWDETFDTGYASR